MVPELRAMRLKEIAERVLRQYGGDFAVQASKEERGT
jgi:hypothetical protein